MNENLQLKKCLNYWIRICGMDKYICPILVLLAIIYPGNILFLVLGTYWIGSCSMRLFLADEKRGGMLLSMSLPFSRRDLWNTHLLIETGGLGIFGILLCVRNWQDMASLLSIIFVVIFAHTICAVLPLKSDWNFLKGLPAIVLWVINPAGSLPENIKAIVGGAAGSKGFLIMLGIIDVIFLVVDAMVWIREKKKFMICSVNIHGEEQENV